MKDTINANTYMGATIQSGSFRERNKDLSTQNEETVLGERLQLMICENCRPISIVPFVSSIAI